MYFQMERMTSSINVQSIPYCTEYMTSPTTPVQTLLSSQLLELTQKSERTVCSLETKIVTLEREIATHNAGAEEINREHSVIVETVRNEKAMVEVGVA